MSANRRQSVRVELASFDVEEQRREYERFLQEKTDRELALRMEREFQRNNPPRNNDAPQQVNNAPQQVNNAPQQVNVAPQAANAAPQPANAAPQPATAAPQPANAAPQPANAAPQPANAVPQPANAAPQQVNVAHQRANAALRRANVALQRANAAAQQGRVAPRTSPVRLPTGNPSQRHVNNVATGRTPAARAAGGGVGPIRPAPQAVRARNAPVTIASSSHGIFTQIVITNGNHSEAHVVLSDSSDSSDSLLEDEEDDDLMEPAQQGIQPLVGNDRQMFDRELHLVPLDYGQGTSAAYVPPPRIGTPNGQWGDCTMCFDTPINPQGCNKCKQVLGCKTCVQSWFNSSQCPSCPLCRTKWRRTPDVNNMAIIERNRRMRERDAVPEPNVAAITNSAAAATVLQH